MSLYKRCKLHLKCNDNADTTAVVDAMGLASPAAARNTSLMHAVGLVGGGLAFDGMADVVNTGQTFQAVLRNSFTIHLNVKASDGQSDAYAQGLVTSPINSYHRMELFITSSGQLRANFGAYQASTCTAVTETVFVDGENDWKAVAMVFNKVSATQGRIDIYVNGVLAAAGTLGNYALTGQPYTNPNTMIVGASLLMDPIANPFSGVIDNVLLFDQALSPSEIEYLYNAGAGTETLPNCSITAATETGGVVTLTVDGEGDIDIYSRASGASAWTLSLADQSAGAIEISGLTTGATYEFYAVAHSGNQYSEPCSIASIYLHDSTLPTVSEIEAAAAGVIAALGVFKTSGVWNWQISAEKMGTSVYDSIAPFCFIGTIPTAPGREGSMILNRKIRLTALIGQKSLTDGKARTGDAATVGVIELMALVIAALDDWHPGAGFDCDDFKVTDEEEVYKDARKYAVEVSFEANRIIK